MLGDQIWACPVCRERLVQADRSYRCSNRHTYDISASGYVNLLLAHQRKSKEPGDNKLMLAARHRILEAGHFRKLAEELAHKAASLEADLRGTREASFTVLDAGCGEGYYLRSIAAELRKGGSEIQAYGTDISKDAVAMAAGSAGAVHYAVASSRQLPVLAQAVDCLFQIFAPHSDSEFHRVLSKHGRLVTVIPGKHHLYGVKELLYPQPYYNDEAEHPYPSFTALEQVRIQDEIVLTDSSAIRDLVTMTPYYWRTDPDMLDKLAEQSEIRTPLEFVVTIYGKDHRGGSADA
jgi:23S rRNA (guanine745-N1)-methyltransferase